MRYAKAFAGKRLGARPPRMQLAAVPRRPQPHRRAPPSCESVQSEADPC